MGDLYIRPRTYAATIVVAIMIPTLALLLSSNEKSAQAQNTPAPSDNNVASSSTKAQGKEQPKPVPAAPQKATPKTVQVVSGKYPLHQNIIATVFWVGEDATSDNSFIDNRSSAWASDWVTAFGGVDDPNQRNGYYPSFTPKENPFYFALPYGDFTASGIKSNITQAYWYNERKNSPSILKNRWIKVTYGGRTVYGQWQDVGPYEDNDISYVFGSSKPKQRVGLDVSPAMQDFLGFKGMANVSWQFVDDSEVPPGPWKSIVTSSPPRW